MRDLKRPNSLEPAWKVLPGLGVRVYTPMSEQIVRRNGRKESELRPIMPDLLFVEGDRKDLDVIVARISTLQYRYVKGKAQGTVMSVRDEEMEAFIRATESYGDRVKYYTAGEITPEMMGKEIRIIGGPLDGMHGRLLKKRGLRSKQLVVDLEGILTATVTVEPELIEII